MTKMKTEFFFFFIQATFLLTEVSVAQFESSELITPGVCPKIITDWFPSHKPCFQDWDCPKGLKCCGSKYVKVCVMPEYIIAGTCPFENLFRKQICDFYCQKCPLGTKVSCLSILRPKLPFCRNLCENNKDCPNGEMCCWAGCMKKCIKPRYFYKPIEAKNGTCPRAPKDVMTDCMVSCSDDKQCPGSKKCCNYGCRRDCMEPVKSEPGEIP